MAPQSDDSRRSGHLARAPPPEGHFRAVLRVYGETVRPLSHHSVDSPQSALYNRMADGGTAPVAKLVGEGSDRGRA
jgi:hypothetical protein